MRSSDTAESYARALFDLAVLSDAVDAVDEGMSAIAETVRSHSGLRDTLLDAVVPGSKKREILREIFGESAAPEAVSVTSAMVERGHTRLIDDVARLFREIAERERGVVVAEVTTAVPLDDGMREKVAGKLSASLDRPVTLRERVDASILGGIVIKVAGRVLDGSLSSQLNAMRVTLSTTPQGGEG